MTRNKKIFLGSILFLLITGIVVFTIILFCLTVDVRSRLSQRRWQVPSIVYSDSEIIFLGERISREDFIQMLLTRGYRFVSNSPRLPGRFTSTKRQVRVFLRDFSYPDYIFHGFLLTVTFRKGAIETLRKGKKLLDLVALEPMEIARLFGKDREARELLSYNEIPRYLVDAIIITEDKRYFQHKGMDLQSILRALWVDLRHGKVLQGGSTITQQLAKNYFLRPERSLSRKAKEALIALILESLYSKEEILEMYMNEIYMGQQEGTSINGMGEAARYYFGHDVKNLSLAEAALLAGLIRAPNFYSPFLHPDRARKRRDFVLKKMLQANMITREAYEKAVKEPVILPSLPGISRDNLYYVDFLKRQLESFYPAKVLTGRGLRIFTTLRPEFQEAAVQAVRSGLEKIEQRRPSLKRPGKPLQAAMIVLQPKTGKILAMVGGRNYAKTSFNRAVDAHRQPGSLFKPFVYLTALDDVTPATVILDAPDRYIVKGKTWTPRNYDGKYHGKVTVRTALEFSLNAATVNLAARIGLKNIIKTARNIELNSRLEPYPSLALGSFEMTPLELARAYCIFANNGRLPYLLTFRDVVSEDGRTEQKRDISTKTVCSPAKAYLVTSMLEGVVRRGTARNLKRLGIHFPCAGKTGTTSGYRDSWFVGFTNELLAIVWVGFDDNANTHLSGSTGAMILWADFMKRVQSRFQAQPFTRPAGVVSKWISVNVDWPPVTIQPRQYQEVFLQGHVPKMASPVKRRPSHHRGSLIRNLLKGIWKGLQNVFR
ncbi:MAG: PBP1A family penicillin-binding protein [Deltaproteobacteria bacterium]|nr:PBP1A family penicillin-binding protein [Deltaproteobacteria bacterium]